VTAAAGPFGVVTATLNSQGVVLPVTRIAGRASPGDPLDGLTLEAGHWPTAANQIVLSESLGFFPGLGTTMSVTTAPGTPQLAPFVEAWALIGILMAVLIVADVVSGALVASYRRIGVLKSVGFGPAQVVVSYLVRVGLPALVGG
jgi:hypothetical protein